MKKSSSWPRAHGYLRSKVEAYDDQSPPDAQTVTQWKQEFNRLLDHDTNEAESHQDRLKLKALHQAATHAFDSMSGTSSAIAVEAFDDLVGLATGERKQTGLEPVKPRLSQRTAREEWELACAVVATKRGWDQREGFEKWLMRKTGKTHKQLKKLIDNMDQEKGPYDAVKTNIRDIEARLAKGEDWMFDDLK